MKKTILSLAFILAVITPTGVFAIPSPLENGGVLGLFAAYMVGAFPPGTKLSAVPPQNSTATQKDLFVLNNRLENVDLLNQRAGGALDTAEILK